MQIGVDSQRAVENRRIFVVAGDEIIRAALQFMLHDEYETHEFGELAAALAKAADGSPDLVILGADQVVDRESEVPELLRRTLPAAALLVVGEGPEPHRDVGLIPTPLRVESVRAVVANALGSAAGRPASPAG